MSKNKMILFLYLFFLSGCQKYYLTLRQIPVDSEYLASHHVSSPDPRQLQPFFGQKVVMQWSIPSKLLLQNPQLVFHIIYKDHTQESMVYPIKHRNGVEIFSILNDTYQLKEGILTYQAYICTQDGTIYRDWKHQLWVQLIKLEDSTDSFPSRSSDSVSSQLKQGSVTETP